MTLNQTDELAVGLEPAPLELRLPPLSEPQGAAPLGKILKMGEGFFQQVRLGKPTSGRGNGIEGLPGPATDAGLARQQHEPLARKSLLEASQGLAQLALADHIESLVEVPDHVELIVDDL